MIVRPWLLRRPVQPCPRCRNDLHLRLHLVRPFHSSSSRADERGLPNHYETLQLDATASAADIKKQFYTLSKSHHPDLHPNDPTAAQRFVKISEAYATLGSPSKKSAYDRDFLRATSSSSQPQHPSGSFSSASTPAGGRPASGLSRRRTQFRGPPPSFYRSGGWGEHGAKRAEHAAKASHSHEAQGRAQSGPAGPAGTGPGGFTQGFDNDVPHFDQRGHYETHSGIERTRHAARRRSPRVDEADLQQGMGGSELGNFVVLLGVLGAIGGVSMLMLGSARGGDGGRGRKGKEYG